MGNEPAAVTFRYSNSLQQHPALLCLAGMAAEAIKHAIQPLSGPTTIEWDLVPDPSTGERLAKLAIIGSTRYEAGFRPDDLHDIPRLTASLLTGYRAFIGEPPSPDGA